MVSWFGCWMAMSTSGTFPLTPRTSWRERRVGSVNAAFLATVNAESGAARIYLQPRTDPTAAAWAGSPTGGRAGLGHP